MDNIKYKSKKYPRIAFTNNEILPETRNFSSSVLCNYCKYIENINNINNKEQILPLEFYIDSRRYCTCNSLNFVS